MNRWTVYRAALGLLPPGRRAFSAGGTVDPDQADKLRRILRKHRTVGATAAFFDEKGVSETFVYGFARLKNRVAAACDTVYRTASVSKMITAMGAMRLAKQGKIDLDADLERIFPVRLHHPGAPLVPVTLRMLLTHTSGIRDGKDYGNSFLTGKSLSDLMKGDSHTAHLPGGFEYSNLGAGIVACVLEEILAKPFDEIMRDVLFSPLGIRATFYPQKAGDLLADAYRVLPPRMKLAYDARARIAHPLPDGYDAERDYLLANGSLCLDAAALARLGAALMSDEYADMRKPHAAFGNRAENLTECLGMFALRDDGICSRTLYGHQGMAYGAVHMVFFDPITRRGVVLLTSGASEARCGVLADLNRETLAFAFGKGGLWSGF